MLLSFIFVFSFSVFFSSVVDLVLNFVFNWFQLFSDAILFFGSSLCC